MPRTNFTTSTPITSEFLNKVARPRISTVDDDGAISPLTNADLANTPGSLQFDFYSLASALQVVQSPLGGLSVLIKGGTVRKSDGLAVRLSDTTLPVPNNTVSVVWVDQQATIQVTSTRPQIGAVLATVTSVNGAITSIADDRVSVDIRPRTNIIDVFGGQSQTDYIVPASTDVVLSGSIDCRNFVLPQTSRIFIRGNLTIRASGTVDLFGNILTQYFQNAVPAVNMIIGGMTFRQTQYFGDPTIDSSGYPVRGKRRSRFFAGLVMYQGFGNTNTATQALIINFTPNFGLFDTADNGAEFVVNAAGRVTVGSNVLIDMRPKMPAVPTTPLPSSISTAGHPSTGTFPPNWGCTLSYTSAQGAAGNIILQSVSAVEIRSNAVLNCQGSNQGWHYRQTFTEAGLTGTTQALGNDFQKPGAGGGGGIWLNSPVIDSHPSVTYNVSAGTMTTPSATNLFTAGVGGVGKGFTGSDANPITTTNEAKPGTLTTIYGIPVEF